ncbi:MAG: hypothetical protein KDD82_05275 [Planctomycetes bacterium]|nr:hypothetical protein [Planctomycetota bacterium]
MSAPGDDPPADFEALYAQAERLGKLVEGTLERALARGLHSAEDLGGKLDHLRLRLEDALARAHAKLSASDDASPEA